ncbi:DUF2894 domain-containing protein [Hydrogenophaga palleronii]|uniref:DUF2894 domain-containing protein n=1 Tax=Hydrogenophaga palleronii TaxID=65655 RepID=UPI0008263F3F|nr:DUF2894 domain-containing protein [Hydrogenophaga palleronii]
MGEHASAVRAHQQAALARRLQTAPEAVRALLQARVAQEAQPADGPAVADTPAPQQPARSRPRAAPAKPLTPLGELNRHISERTGLPAGARSELRSAQAFRETWARLCAEAEVVQAVRRGPENAGPLNSHMLVLRTLGLLSDCSPDYLRRFMAQTDTLLWLEHTSARLKQPAAKTRAPRQKK